MARRPQRTQSINLPDWLSALANVGLLGLALYGVFFTDIPERLITNLNAEVSSLRTERAQLASQMETLMQDKSIAEQRLHSLDSEINQFKSRYEDYVQRTFPEVVGAYVAQLKINLTAKQDIANKAAKLENMYEWMTEEESSVPPYPRKWLTTKGDVENWNKAFHSYIDRMPREFMMEAMAPYTRDTPNLPLDEMMAKYQLDLKNELEQSPLSGFDMAEQAFSTHAISLLGTHEAAALKARLNKYLSNKSDIYKLQVSINLKGVAADTRRDSRSEITEEGKRISHNVALILKDIPALNQYLLAPMSIPKNAKPQNTYIP